MRYVYTFACHESEQDLCRMELGELLGQAPEGQRGLIPSDKLVDPNRSPFLTGRLDVVITGSTAAEVAVLAEGIGLSEQHEQGSIQTFKVQYLKEGDPFSYEEQRRLERWVGGSIQGKARMKSPDIVLGLTATQGNWMLGMMHTPRREWLAHKQKPQNYSTGLSSRAARALVNIAAPRLEGISLLDPCCGMGNVLIEALSMGLTAEGCDINPLAVRGARVNLRHYGYSDDCVRIADMNTYTSEYDTAVLDLPYNVCSVFPEEEKSQTLASLRRLSRRAVIVSTEPLGELLQETGWRVLGHITTRKSTFIREIWLCE
ncbi:TRM11 family SAM-dependent methyltransferase [Paenibacillus lemnae]|uniref:RNA methyltransferase n=1 Tax=Paenibacillus lemnae TaxID=1330551 RepID=A0A848M505_PAELE|nr:RsmD family RNA methyltransferase [Paenibacillus lemnae]NMO95686.1 RNA methyltransferase [Paenibacillus lemnae]